MDKSLYKRLGSEQNILKIASDIVDNHHSNKAVSTRFKEGKMTIEQQKNAVATFISTGTGGPENYQGQDMLAAHKGMNISAVEFMAVLDDSLNALIKNDVGQREQEEMLFILYSMRAEIVLI